MKIVQINNIIKMTAMVFTMIYIADNQYNNKRFLYTSQNSPTKVRIVRV